MLADFSFLKQALTECVHDPLDHGFIVYEYDNAMRNALAGVENWKTIVLPYIPTAENIARWSFEKLKVWFEEHVQDIHRFSFVHVSVWETPTSVATYGEDNG
jgi:6-pyruvoyltetrahydropterin/6-carboxytetrahydropterin synthase